MVQEMPDSCGFWVEVLGNIIEGIKEKAQLKNFQEGRGTQNSKQGAHTLQACDQQ